MSASSGSDDDIEVGAEGAEIRLWRAQLERQQAEGRVTAQLSSIQAMEARAGSILAWSVAAIVGLTATQVRPAAILMFSSIAFAIAAGSSIFALWPAAWRYAAFLPSELRNMPGSTELEVVEQIVTGLEDAIIKNDCRLVSFALSLQAAWVAFGSGALLSVTAALLRSF